MSNTFQVRLQAKFSASDQAKLDRILLRAGSDLDHTLATIGTGAPSTVKRSKAVRMAVAGSEVAAIATAAGLSEARVMQVLENALAAGLPALYPTFVETVSLPNSMLRSHLWEAIWQAIHTQPPDNGVRAAVWTPAIVTDYLIYTGTLQDTSVSDIASLIRQCMDSDKKPVSFDFTDSMHDEGKQPGLAGSMLFLAIALGILALGIWTKQVFLLLASLVMLPIMAMQFIKRLLEKRLLRSVLAKKSALPAEPVEPVTPEVPWPAPKFSILHALSLPAVPLDLESIADQRNAVGEPPLRVLYLWVFASQYDQGGFETEGWPQLGPVHLLLNSTALSIGQLARATKQLLVGDQATLDRTIAGYSDAAGTYDRPELFVDGSLGKRVYRGYPIHTLVCNDVVWKPAVHQLAARCDLAVVNLSGYNPSHPGLEYEIRHLFSGGPPSRFVFVYERATDADAVISGVLDLWSRLEREPAKVGELLFLRIPDSQDVGYQLQFQKTMIGTGWLAKVHLGREGEYVPIAPRIVSYLNNLQASEAQS